MDERAVTVRVPAVVGEVFTPDEVWGRCPSGALCRHEMDWSRHCSRDYSGALMCEVEPYTPEPEPDDMVLMPDGQLRMKDAIDHANDHTVGTSEPSSAARDSS